MAFSLQLSYYAKIQQSTGEDWNDATLILSTAQPALGGNLPSLGTLEAKFKRVQPETGGQVFGGPSNVFMMKSARVARAAP